MERSSGGFVRSCDLETFSKLAYKGIHTVLMKVETICIVTHDYIVGIWVRCQR